MKNCIFILLFLTLASQTSYSQWEVVNPPKFFQQNFQGITFIDSLTGYLWSNKNIYKTTNSGSEWNLNYNSGNYNIRKVYFINSDTGFVTYSKANSVLRTTNGAASWHESYVGSFYYSYVGISFLNNKTGYIVGGGETRLDARRTTNAGETWSYLAHINGSYTYFHDVHFKDSLDGFITGHKYFIRTTNGGASWYSINLQNDVRYYDLSFLNQNTGFVSYYSTVARTFTGGNVWFSNPINQAISRVTLKAISNDAIFALSRKYEIYKSSNLGLNWYLKNNDTVNHLYNRLSGIAFFDDSVGFAVGDEAILKSTNKGETWNYLIERYDLNSIKAKSSDNIIAVGNNSAILKSEDFGETWVRINNNYHFNLNHIALDNSNFIIAGDSGNILYSSNSNSWNHIKLTTNKKLLKIFPTIKYNFVIGEHGDIFYNKKDSTWIDISPSQFSNIPIRGVTEVNDNFFAVGDHGKIIKSTDFGNNWVEINFPSMIYLQDIKFVNENKGYIVGSASLPRSSVFVTNDGGFTWDSIYLNGGIPYNNLNEIQFFDDNTGYLLGTPSYLTTNGGKSWNVNAYINAKTYNSFLNLDSGFALSYYRDQILRTTNFFQSFQPVSILNTSNEIPENYSLSTFPNPFNPTSKIRFNLIKTEFVTLKIYDISGREITTLIKDKINAGTHEILFSADEFSLSSGVYFLTMQTENSFLTSKMILLR